MKATTRALRISVLAVAFALSLSALAFAAEKETLRGKIKSIDPVKRVFVVEAPFGKTVAFTADRAFFEKLRKGDAEKGDLVSVWYTRDGDKNTALHIRLARGCG